MTAKLLSYLLWTLKIWAYQNSTRLKFEHNHGKELMPGIWNRIYGTSFKNFSIGVETLKMASSDSIFFLSFIFVFEIMLKEKGHIYKFIS